MDAIPVRRLKQLDMRFVPRPWPFADQRRAEIDAHFAELRREKPALFNGRVLVMHRHTVEGDTLRGEYLETDFASFIAWRDWDFPDRSARNCFALGALRGSDGVFVLGVMGSHTANAGRIYFPGGTPDPSDVVGDAVDLEGSVRREFDEETGLTPDDYDVQPGWHVAFAGPRIALIKTLQGHEPADALRARIASHLAQDPEPELAGVHLVRGRVDLHPMMPPFVVAFFEHFWAEDVAAPVEVSAHE